jgi:hypothetical protein
MPEKGASGSVGAPSEESGALPGNGLLPLDKLGGPLHLFRLRLEQTSLRAGKVTVFCVREPLRSFLATGL